MRKIILSICISAIALSVHANTYYFSAAGNDANNGLTVDQAWATIHQLNTFNFSAGDVIMLEGGTIFNGAIYNPSFGNGVPGNPITLTSYGTGKATISSGLEEGFFLNRGNFTISNLKFLGSGYKITSAFTNGIDIYIDSTGSTDIDNIKIDSVEAVGYGGWGILMSNASDGFGFHHVSVTNCLLHDNGTGGFQINGSLDKTTQSTRFSNSDVYVGYTKAYNNYGRAEYDLEWTGAGILVSGTVNGLVEYCEAYANGKENGSPSAGPVGIFLGDSKYVTIQHCSSHHNSGGPSKHDGGGFDLDQGSYGCVIQYCESYENQGAGYGLYQAPTVNPWAFDTIRYNTSTNDGRSSYLYGAITFWGAGAKYKVTDAQVYGNQVNMNKPGYGLIFISSYLYNAFISDNIFCLEPPASYLNYNSSPQIPTGASVTNSSFPCTIQPQAPFISPVTYRGAFAPAPTAMWSDGWTNYNPQNIVYPVTDSIIQTPITSNTTLSGTKKYLIRGLVFVKNGAELTIRPGCILRGDNATPNSSLIITKGSKIFALGTSSKPIVFTSNQPIGARSAGDWAGLIILGKAHYNGSGGENYIQGLDAGPDTQFGGGVMPDDDDNSGVLQYIRIEYAGFNEQINGLTLGAVGRGTTIDHIQVSYSNDDAFEWAGGSVNCKYLVAYKSLDDNWDARNGYNGAVQFCLGLRDPDVADNTPGSASEGFESGNDVDGSSATPFTAALFCNMTEIGPLRGNPDAAISGGFRRTVRFSNSARLRMLNSILMDYPTGVFVDGDSCTALASGTYISPLANKSPGNLVFKNNLVAGNQAGSVLEKNTDWNMSKWFGDNKNDSLIATSGILISPYTVTDNNVFAGDYRPSAGSPALSNYNWNDSAFYRFDSTGNKTNFITCPITVAAPVSIIGPTNPYSYIQSGDTAKYYLSAKSIFGILRSNWTVPSGVTIQSGQGTDTLVVKFASTFNSGSMSVQNLSYCGALSVSRVLTLKKILPVIYTFTGDGNWNIAANWSGNLIPPSSLPSGSEIIIAPASNGSCILNVPQTILPGGKITVQQGKNFIILGSLSTN